MTRIARCRGSIVHLLFVVRATLSLLPRHNNQHHVNHIARWSLMAQKDNFEYIDPSLVEALDLRPLMERVAEHTGTFRGRQAVLALVADVAEGRKADVLASPKGKRQKWLQEALEFADRKRSFFRTSVANNVDAVQREYDRVAQATLALTPNEYNLTWPPLYGADSSPMDTAYRVDSDDDEWLRFGSADQFSLENVLQAEQVLRKLLQVHEWANQESHQTWLPLLTDVGLRIEREPLQRALEDVQGSVAIQRVRSLTDPSGRSTYQIRLSDEKFVILQKLRQKEADLQELLDGNRRLEHSLAEIQEELESKEAEIQYGLALSILRVANEIDKSLNIVAHLDVLFAKAAFGLRVNGQIPVVRTEGQFAVDGFVHPLLGLQQAGTVPIDLMLSTEDGNKALVISGSNGGGKTLSLKSFGIACFLSKLGIAIPSSINSTPRVDFFATILTSVGDGQDLARGQSTFTAHLNSYARIIRQVAGEDSQCLVLLDELGSGTEAAAGGAIGQAVLEQLLQNPGCRVVATTHSPRLKTLSFQSPNFDCASVLLSKEEEGEYRRPTFQLQYGVIGESYAMGAASRCTPPFPEQLLQRAADLLLQSDTADDEMVAYTRALSQSLEKQIEIATAAKERAEDRASDVTRLRRAMLSLASNYDRHLALLEHRVQGCFQRLKYSAEPLELLGETLQELRVVQKQVKTERELLKERGLKVLSSSYELVEGVSVVILAEGEWEGSTGKVASPGAAKLSPDEVLVVPSFRPWDDMVPGNDYDVELKPLVFKRYQLAVWDYDSVWDAFDGDNDIRLTSVPDAKQRLDEVLLSLSSAKTWPPPSAAAKSASKPSLFTSSRERKAAKKKKPRKK